MNAKTFDRKATALVGPYLSSRGIAPEDFHLHCLKIGRVWRFSASRTKRIYGTKRDGTPCKFPQLPRIVLFDARGREDCLANLRNLPRNSVEYWVRRHRPSIDAVIRAACGPDARIDDEERALWVSNDESLYLRAKAEGVNFE